MNANDSQIGGNHYARAGAVQHWDYVVRALGNRYLEGAITKYVTRHRFKGLAVQDLKKALHFTQKLIEEARSGRVYPMIMPHDLQFSIHDFSVGAGLNVIEDRIVKKIASWETDQELELIALWIRDLLIEAEAVQHHNEGVKAGARPARD